MLSLLKRLLQWERTYSFARPNHDMEHHKSLNRILLLHPELNTLNSKALDTIEEKRKPHPRKLHLLKLCNPRSPKHEPPNEPMRSSLILA